MPNLHGMSLGMVDLSKSYKKPALFSIAAFVPHPTPWAIATNDFTSKLMEPEIMFPKAWLLYLTWFWNLRINYPWAEIFLGDDNISGAFRQVNYNPNLVAMPAFLVFGVLYMSTGQTFEDCTSPANWGAMARNRQQYARYLWYQGTTLARALKHLPNLQFAAIPPPPPVVATFVQATPDPLNQGVLDATGTRL
jgi:hypothetical protein